MDELEDVEGIKIGSRNINNIRYADDTVLLADKENKQCTSQAFVDKNYTLTNLVSVYLLLKLYDIL